MTLVGTGLGFVGIAVLVLPGGLADGTAPPCASWGLVVVIAAAACWAVGSFASSRMPMPADAFVATTWEMLAGGVGLMLAATAPGARGFAMGDVAGEAWAWLAYLVVFGSLVAFSAYVWLLLHAPISLTATYAYVNPVVAVLSARWCSTSRSRPWWSVAARSWSPVSAWSCRRSGPDGPSRSRLATARRW